MDRPEFTKRLSKCSRESITIYLSMQFRNEHVLREIEAIEHAEDVAQSNNCSCAKEHEQLAKWLKQLQEQRELEYRLLENFIDYMPKVYRERNCNWIIVKEFLQRGTAFAGSTSSRKKCIFLGIDPDGYTLEREKLNENS